MTTKGQDMEGRKIERKIRKVKKEYLGKGHKCEYEGKIKNKKKSTGYNKEKQGNMWLG